MLIPVRYLVDRVRHGSAVAGDVAAVRRRLVAAPRREDAGAEERALADELLRLREALAAAFGSVASCSGCARGHPLPHGRWDGGHCCGTRTEQVFTDDEIAALRVAGTKPEHLAPPSDDGGSAAHGCAFRGPSGCALPPAHRPSLCVRFICRELEDELRERGDLRAVRAIAADLAKTSERWRRVRALAIPLPEPWESQ